MSREAIKQVKHSLRGRVLIRRGFLGSVLFFFLMMSAPSHAETSAPVPKKEVSALQAFMCGRADVLQKSEGVKIQVGVQEHYEHIKSFKARFVQESYLAALDASERSSGNMMFLKPGRMRWDYQSPEKQSFILKDDALSLYQPEENQLVLDSFSQLLITDLPVAFIMGIGNLTKDFVFESACRNGSGTVLTLKPKVSKEDRKRALDAFRLLVDDKTLLPKGARVADIGGNITSIVFMNSEENPTLSSEAFDLTPPAGTDIIDRRKGE